MELNNRIGNDLLESARAKLGNWLERGYGAKDPGSLGLNLHQWRATFDELAQRRREAWHRRAEGIAIGCVVWSIASCTARAAGWLP